MSRRTVSPDASIGTKAIWSGEEDYLMAGATQVPIVNSVAFGYDDVDTWYEAAIDRSRGYIYNRSDNPTVNVFEAKMKALEGAEAAASFASGMAAIGNTLFALLSPGEHAVTVKDVYGGSNKIFTEHLPRFGVKVSQCETHDFDGIEAAVRQGCKLLYLETPTNPTLKIMDLVRLSQAAHDVGALVVVDNTFATPVNQNPLRLGADIVVHSATKYIGGHADTLGGVICGRKELVERVYNFRVMQGATLHPVAAYMLIRGLKTLHLRVRQQNQSAMRIAQFLQQQAVVTRVYYPGLEDHPGHDIAVRQMRGFGGIVSFELRGGFESVRTVLPRLQYAHLAGNLGAVETIVGPPRTTSHVELTTEERAAIGIPESLIRYSVGIEDTEDLIGDLDQALAAIR